MCLLEILPRCVHGRSTLLHAKRPPETFKKALNHVLLTPKLNKERRCGACQTRVARRELQKVSTSSARACYGMPAARGCV